MEGARFLALLLIFRGASRGAARSRPLNVMPWESTMRLA